MCHNSSTGRAPSDNVRDNWGIHPCHQKRHHLSAVTGTLPAVELARLTHAHMRDIRPYRAIDRYHNVDMKQFAFSWQPTAILKFERVATTKNDPSRAEELSNNSRKIDRISTDYGASGNFVDSSSRFIHRKCKPKLRHPANESQSSTTFQSYNTCKKMYRFAEPNTAQNLKTLGILRISPSVAQSWHRQALIGKMG